LSRFISDEKLTEIKQAADIVEVISEYVMLKKTGKNYVGLCPFHTEKTPSFTVTPEKQIFYCFGCHAGGNVISFLMKHDNLSFPEAARLLARQYGVPLPQPQVSGARKAQLSEREKLLSVNRSAMTFFHQTLVKKAVGRTPLTYLKQRGLSGQDIDDFQLGYAPRSWDALLTHLTRKGVSRALIHKAGLIVPNKQETGFYDRFRERVVFPIFDAHMQVIGFGGRVMDDALPKYLNSPETLLFNKRKCLYGLPQAKNACRQSGLIFIVEGYFDLLALHHHGLKNVCATLGTAFTVEHLSLIRGFSRRVVLVFDSDQAGINAARRSVPLFVGEGVDARILTLPSGHDPDSFINAFGRDAFLERAQQAADLMSFLMDVAVKKHGMSVNGKMKVLRDLAPPLAGLADPVARQLYTHELAERLGVDEAAVLERINRTAAGGQRRGTDARRKTNSATEPPADPDNYSMVDLLRNECRLEGQIFEMIVNCPEIVPEIKRQRVLDHMRDPRLRALGESILQCSAEADGNVGRMISSVDDPEIRNILTLFAVKDAPWSREGCEKVIAGFKARRPIYAKDTIIEEIKAAEAIGDYDKVFGLQKKLQESVKKGSRRLGMQPKQGLA